jgi:hypothetical protein
MEGAELLTGRCVPTKRRIVLTVDGLAVSAVTLARNDEITVFLMATPPINKKVHYLSDEFQVTDIEKGRVIKVTVLVLRDDEVKSVTVPYPARYQKGIRHSLNIFVSFPDNKTDFFELKIPPVIFDSTEIQLPKIRFEKKVWAGISPLNC